MVTFLLTGGDEDRACAEYIIACLSDDEVETHRFVARVSESRAATGFILTDDSNFPSGDIPLCAEVDRFDFPLVVRREDGFPVLSKLLE